MPSSLDIAGCINTSSLNIHTPNNAPYATSFDSVSTNVLHAISSTVPAITINDNAHMSEPVFMHYWHHEDDTDNDAREGIGCGATRVHGRPSTCECLWNTVDSPISPHRSYRDHVVSEYVYWLNQSTKSLQDQNKAQRLPLRQLPCSGNLLVHSDPPSGWLTGLSSWQIADTNKSWREKRIEKMGEHVRKKKNSQVYFSQSLLACSCCYSCNRSSDWPCFKRNFA